ncbi:hypothetical protein HUJ05_001791 [Dendroctonus ponderosae]|nr:hypothetical protein HUJ05_001791 [Dendroctonus ponderosae]
MGQSICLVNSPAATEEEATDPVEATSNTNDLESLGEASASTNTIFGTTPTSLPNKKKKRTPNMQPHSVASVLEKYLETTTATASTNNCLKHFFNAMYETAQAFPPGLQIQVKSKIFGIIQEAELSCLQAKDYPQFSSVQSSGYEGFHRNPHLHPQNVQPLARQEMTSLQFKFHSHNTYDSR